MKTETKEIKKFINPLDIGVTYEEFLKSVPNGTDLKTHLKGHLNEEDVNWILNEIENYKLNLKK